MASRAPRVFWWLMVSTLFPYSALAAKLQAQTLRAWEQYQQLTEARIRRELESTEGFLVRDFFENSDSAAVRKAIENGNVFIKAMKTLNEEGGEIEIPKGIVHHWYGSVFVPDATVDEVLAWEQDYDNHESYFDEVEDSRLDSHGDDTFEIFLRLRRTKVITVHYNTEHRVTYERFGDGAAASRSESTRIAEIENPGTEREREKPVGNDRGFLWRLNSYWRFLQAPEGVIVECESISLSRTIPIALLWVVKPFINSVPRESLEATLLPLREAFALASEPRYVRSTRSRQGVESQQGDAHRGAGSGGYGLRAGKATRPRPSMAPELILEVSTSSARRHRRVRGPHSQPADPRPIPDDGGFVHQRRASALSGSRPRVSLAPIVIGDRSMK